MPSIINLAATTELEAVNAMLSAIGEAPIDDVDTATQADVLMAINTLRNVTREVQSMGWRFNTEFGYQVAPEASTFEWTDTDDEVTDLNIFLPPSGLIRFTVTPTAEQNGLDVVIRPSRSYTAGAPAAAVLVFYDRSLNRDGLDSEKFDFLYINPVWLFNFEHMPEVARRYCVVKAARTFIQEQVGSTTLVGFTERDEAMALTNLINQEGEDEDLNMFNNASVLRHLGRRPVASLGMLYDPRKSPGPV